MLSLIGVLLLASTAQAYDAIIFSSSKTISNTNPSVSSLVSSASSSSPLVFLVAPHFTLGQFSKAASLYSTQKSSSSIVTAAKSASSASSRYIDEAIPVSGASSVSSVSTFSSGQSVYIVSADNWASLDKLSSEMIPLVGPSATFIVTSSNAVTDSPVRVKRVSTDDSEGGSVTGDQSFPIVLPNEGQKAPCLFYLEGLTIVGKKEQSYYSAYIRDSGSEGYKWSGSVECPDKVVGSGEPVEQTFTVNIPKNPNGKNGDGNSIEDVSFKLTTRSDKLGYWNLVDVKLLAPLSATFKPQQGSPITITAGTEAKLHSNSINHVKMNSVFGHGWNCWDSQAVFWDAQDNSAIGISLHGVQIQVYAKGNDGKDIGYFVSKVDSCTGTFSASSWMGIITALVLFAVFIFGFLMLNSVQTMDRFDDPKQKQILINVRE